MKYIIQLMQKIIIRYELKHPEYVKPTHICTSLDTRNRYKNDKWKIPEDQPQCPVYKDNRCCGGCKFTAECQHCMDCNCYGFTYAAMGGKDKNYYLHDCTKYKAQGYKLKRDGKFDWDSSYEKRALKKQQKREGKKKEE